MLGRTYPEEGWARMLYVLTPCQPFQVEGLGVLKEVTEGIDVVQSQ
jgi:hypothetical protein